MHKVYSDIRLALNNICLASRNIYLVFSEICLASSDIYLAFSYSQDDTQKCIHFYKTVLITTK